MAGESRMPPTLNLIRDLLGDAIARSELDAERPENHFQNVIHSVTHQLGFEVTLSDLLQICPTALRAFYAHLAEIDHQCTPNRIHELLAYWLETGGTVVTTNYDTLIERAGSRSSRPPIVRYRTSGDGFSEWRSDLDDGGVLFKIHGSIDEPESCLGALEHVATRLAGDRAELLAAIMGERPVCFIGWRGADPDAPSVLGHADPLASNAFWIHYEGDPPGSQSIKSGCDSLASIIQHLGRQHPVLTEADRLCDRVIGLLGLSGTRSPATASPSYSFSSTFESCTPSGTARLVGIALRRARCYTEALDVLDTAAQLLGTAEEHWAARQETALLHWSRNHEGDQDKALRLLGHARGPTIGSQDPWLEANHAFGMVSMTVLACRKRPWLWASLPMRFGRYSKNIQALAAVGTDSHSVALHESLYALYSGRVRLTLLGWAGAKLPLVADWILAPFDFARGRIRDAQDIHLHSLVDVLAYRAIAGARLRRCMIALEDLAEVDRLVLTLADAARQDHWSQQRREISVRCPIHG